MYNSSMKDAQIRCCCALFNYLEAEANLGNKLKGPLEVSTCCNTEEIVVVPYYASQTYPSTRDNFPNQNMNYIFDVEVTT